MLVALLLLAAGGGVTLAAPVPDTVASRTSGKRLDQLKLLVPPLREQATEIEGWIDERVHSVLPALMAENDVQFWVLVQREYAEDTVWRSVESPTRVNARRRTVVVFELQPDGEVAMSSFVSAPSTLDPAGPWSSELFWGPIRELLLSRSGTISVNKDVSVPKAFTDGAHAGELQAFVEAMGEVVEARITSTPPLPTYFLALRLPAMLPRYRDAMELSHGIISEAMSASVSNACILDVAPVCSSINVMCDHAWITVWGVRINKYR
jgi:hypothetical protein